ncbi:hypothetical protein ACOSP7_018997 [Xanthoceras sorbifolium]
MSSLLYSTSFKYPEGDLRKNQEIFMDSSPHYHPQQQQQQNHHHHQQNSGLMRYRSAPSSFFESLVNGGGSSNDIGTGGGGNCDQDYRYFRSSSPEIDTFLAKYMLPTPSNCSGDSGNSSSHDFQEFGEKSMKQEEAETNGYSANNGSSQMIYQSLQVQGPGNDNNTNNNNNNGTMDGSFGGAANSMVLENPMQTKMGTGNGSNLIRQNSSPAGIFSNLGVDNGFAAMRDVGCFRGAGNGTNGDQSGPSTSRLNNHINFSSGSGPSSRLMRDQVGENERGSRGNSTTGSNRQYMSNFTSDSWDDTTSFNGLKRARENDGNIFFGLNTLETQNENSGSRSNNGLIHHLSLPKTSSEMAAVEKFLHFQGSIPCKIRAKRGCATHPRSIAERVRRTRISERMRKLHDLFPNMDKQTNTADMLDLAVEYIKDLQKQVKTLTDTKAKCMCSSKQKQY